MLDFRKLGIFLLLLVVRQFVWILYINTKFILSYSYANKLVYEGIDF